MTILTLEDAIRHAEECADRCENLEGKRNKDCADDHRRLASWLRELQERRDKEHRVYCKDCIHSQEVDMDEYDEPCTMRICTVHFDRYGYEERVDDYDWCYKGVSDEDSIQ